MLNRHVCNLSKNKWDTKSCKSSESEAIWEKRPRLNLCVDFVSKITLKSVDTVVWDLLTVERWTKQFESWSHWFERRKTNALQMRPPCTGSAWLQWSCCVQKRKQASVVLSSVIQTHSMLVMKGNSLSHQIQKENSSEKWHKQIRLDRKQNVEMHSGLQWSY